MTTPALAIGAIVQARMSSVRLPGKTLRLLAGQPVLEYVLERLQRTPGLGAAIVATSVDPSDDPIAAYCETRGIPCVRGAMDDVAGRFLHALDARPVAAFVRICADRPLLDIALIDRALRSFREAPVDVVTNAFPVTFPAGQTVEVVDAAAFRAAYPKMTEEADREHVTRYFYRNADGYRIRNLSAEDHFAGVRLVLDTEEDLHVIEAILARMDRPHWTYDVRELAALYHAVTPLTS